MAFDEIKKTINSNFDHPLNHYLWLNDYKVFGKDSYVYNNKKILHELYEDYDLSYNDGYLKDDVFDYVMTENKDVGKLLAVMTGNNEDFKGVDTLGDLFSTFSAFKHLSTDLSGLFDKSTFSSQWRNYDSEIANVINSNLSECESGIASKFLDIWGNSSDIQDKMTVDADTFNSYFSHSGDLVKYIHKTDLYKKVYDNENTKGTIKIASTEVVDETETTTSESETVSGKYILGSYITTGTTGSIKYSEGGSSSTISASAETTYLFIPIDTASITCTYVSASGFNKLFYV